MAAIAAILSALSSTLRVLDFAFPMGILSMLVALVTLICEWTLFGTLRQRLEDNAAVNVTWGVAHWLLLASVITLSPVPFLGVFEYRRARRASKDRGIYAPLKNRKKVPYQF